MWARLLPGPHLYTEERTTGGFPGCRSHGYEGRIVLPETDEGHGEFQLPKEECNPRLNGVAPYNAPIPNARALNDASLISSSSNVF